MVSLAKAGRKEPESQSQSQSSVSENNSEITSNNNNNSNSNSAANENYSDLKSNSSEIGYWLRPQLPTVVLNCVLRQLSEKLDRVRRSAGEIIELIFDSQDADIQAIRFQDDAQIRSIFANHPNVDWSNPEDVFPILVSALDLNCYRRQIFEGLIQSMGSMSSTMSQLTLKCLQPYLSELEEQCESQNEALQQLELLANDMIYCCQKRFHNPLFIVPFFKSIGLLLSEMTYFEPLQNRKFEFSLRLLKQIRKECYKSTDIVKLLASVKVYIGLALYPQTREYALQRLMIYLGYQYPALRKHTAGQLYTAIATYGEKICPVEKCDQVMEFFESAKWGGTDLEPVREQRNLLFDMLEIKSPKLKKTSNK